MKAGERPFRSGEIPARLKGPGLQFRSAIPYSSKFHRG